jgi:hypothetical protein
MNRANYNAVLGMTSLIRHPWGTILALFLMASAAFASNWAQPATDLAKAIGSATGPGTINLSVTNASSLSKNDVAEIQKDIESQLGTAGVRIGSVTNANSEVRVTLSENLQGYLWVAEIKQGNETQVEMVSVGRQSMQPAARGGASVTIRKALLWSQPEQILDAYVDGNHMTLLGAGAVSLFTFKDGKWEQDQSLDIPRTHLFPRDLRGILVPAKDHYTDIYLPGTICNVSAGAGYAISCHDGDDPWPLGPRSALFNSGRNYFTGALVPATATGGPFYSLAGIPRPNYTLLLTLGVDGRLHANDGVNDRTISAGSTADWGSDMAAIRSSCGSGTQLLATKSGDDFEPDSLRAFEIPDRDLVPASTALDFPGPITALWTHSDGSSVTAVDRNLQTGAYEAYSVSVACNQ